MRFSRRRDHTMAFCGAAAVALIIGCTVPAAGPALGSRPTGGSPYRAVYTGLPGRTVDGIEDAGAVVLRTKTNGFAHTDNMIGIPGAQAETGRVAYGGRTENGIEWRTPWRLFSGDGIPGNGYGSQLGTSN